jgi:large subunit ribosomal protein L7Ae
MFVKFEMSKELVNQTYEIIEMAKESGKVRKGANEVTKLIERAQAKFVILSEDTTPPEILAHIPILCEEKKIPYAYVPSKQELGTAAGLKVSTSAVAILKAGKGKVNLENLIKDIEALKPK